MRQESDGMTTNTACDILDVFRQRRDQCRLLLGLSRAQRTLIDSDDYAGLLHVLGRKQRILGNLEEISKRVGNLKQVWRSQRGTIEPELREECEHVLAETEAIFSELMREEGDSTDHLTRRRNATRDQLRAVSQGPHVHAAYRDNLAPATHRHFDVGQ